MKILFVVLDNENYIPHFPLGIAYLSSVLKRKGHQVDIFSQDVHHHTNERLLYVLDNKEYDFVGIGTIAGYFPYRKLLEMCKIINLSKNREKFKLVLGGHMPSAEPKFFLTKTGADIVIVGEAEDTIVEIVEGER